jgi:hypothetical protein
MIKGRRRRGRRLKQLQDDRRGKKLYRKLKEEELGRTLLKTRFGRICALFERQTM